MKNFNLKILSLFLSLFFFAGANTSAQGWGGAGNRYVLPSDPKAAEKELDQKLNEIMKQKIKMNQEDKEMKEDFAKKEKRYLELKIKTTEKVRVMAENEKIYKEESNKGLSGNLSAREKAKNDNLDLQYSSVMQDFDEAKNDFIESKVNLKKHSVNYPKKRAEFHREDIFFANQMYIVNPKNKWAKKSDELNKTEKQRDDFKQEKIEAELNVEQLQAKLKNVQKKLIAAKSEIKVLTLKLKTCNENSACFSGQTSQSDTKTPLNVETVSSDDSSAPPSAEQAK